MCPTFHCLGKTDRKANKVPEIHYLDLGLRFDYDPDCHFDSVVVTVVVGLKMSVDLLEVDQ